MIQINSYKFFLAIKHNYMNNSYLKLYTLFYYQKQLDIKNNLNAQ